LRFCGGLGALLLIAATAGAQQPDPSPAPSSPQPPATPHGTVIFSRSSGDANSANAKPGQRPSDVVSNVTDADRSAVTFTRYAIDVSLRPDSHALSARARFTIRNDGKQPLKQLPLQLSATLAWDHIRLVSDPRPARFARTMIPSDSDHTGQLNEAEVELLQPLAPGASLDLDVLYSGSMAQDATRLQQIGTPGDAALQSDWDQVSSSFVGIRGFGNVAWYPVSSVPVRLGDGDKLFAQVGQTKLRQSNALVSLTVSSETPGDAPNVAILDGIVVPVAFTPGDPNAHVPGLAKASLPEAPLGFQTLSIFLANRQKRSGNALDLYARAADEGDTQAYLAAGSMVTPLLRTWLESALPDRPKPSLAILDLANSQDAPFEERQTLYTGMQPLTAEQLTAPMSHSLSHAYFQSLRPWLNEGVAHFMASLWTEQTRDRDAALAQLDEQRSALSLAEPGDGATDLGASVGDRPNLLNASDAIFYRSKATYVFWMLRSLVGDAALQAALKAYDAKLDTHDDYFEQLVVTQLASAPLPASSTGTVTAKDVHQFFEDWVYTDHGLPDLTITGAFPSGASGEGSYLIAVEVTNSGGSGANVPVTVTSVTNSVTERMYVPAHGRATHRILLQGEPTEVQVNDGIVPETTASVHVQQIHYTQPAKH
jgi:hypothetical protein